MITLTTPTRITIRREGKYTTAQLHMEMFGDAQIQMCTTLAGKKYAKSTEIPLFQILQNHFAAHIVVLATYENWMVNFWTTERLISLDSRI